MTRMAADASSPTLLDVVRKTTDHLRQHGSESARLDAELICAHALQLGRLDLYLQYDRPLSPAQLEPIRTLLRRRSRGEPMAYLLGVREFYGREFAVTSAVLIPRPDTETLVESVLRWARGRGRPLRIADVGTGSGCIGITLAAELPDAEVVLTDVSAEALAVAAENARRLGVDARVEVAEGEWLLPLRDRQPFDALVSNPPYVTAEEFTTLARDVADFEPRGALVACGDGLGPYRQVFDGVGAALTAHAVVAVEVDPRRAQAVADLLRDAMPAADVATVDDLTGRPRVVVGSREG